MTAIIRTARAMMACMQPLTGNRASGTVLVTASGADVVLSRNRYALPVVEGRQRPDLAMKVAEGSGEDGSWTVTSSGTEVSMFSNMGGKRQCIPSGTEFAFDPPIDGIASAVASTPFLGGTDLKAFGAVKDIAMTEHLGSLPLDLSRSSIKGFPCALLTWVDDEPADSATTSMTRRETRLGTRKNLHKLTYQIQVISERAESDHARRATGLEILDQIAELLTDRQAIDGQAFSNPSGLQIIRRWRETGGGPAYQKYYVYVLLISAMVVLKRDDDRYYHPWLTAILNVDKQLDGEPDLRLAENIEINMDPGEDVVADTDDVFAGGDDVEIGE